ncbi:hypothetical protein OBBRIDRAFT_826707 [Obba rivulosa]|uniref:DUF6533 domain-containing protein n=1 Tax=Obba rivulosa TaxID=1052685 RepID=A0A8E2AW22_9APHY|nr:hypothetical protein OBBRIDRAFT_826707 [Obba rivulosa]
MDAQNASAEISTVRGIQINRFCVLTALTVLYWDYCITLPLEIEAFWKKDFITLASILFFLNRYVSLLGHIPISLEFFADLAETRCHELQTYHQFFVVVTQVIVAALLTLRTYALYGQNKRILYLLGTSFVIGTSIGVAFTDWGSNKPGKILSRQRGCDLSLSVQQSRHLTVSWSVVLAFDTLVFALTAIRGVQVRGFWNFCLFHRIFVRDGAVYYGTMVVLNVVNFLTITLPPVSGGIYVIYLNDGLNSREQSEQKGMLTTFTNVDVEHPDDAAHAQFAQHGQSHIIRYAVDVRVPNTGGRFISASQYGIGLP